MQNVLNLILYPLFIRAFSYLTLEFLKSVMTLNTEIISLFSKNDFNFKSNLFPREAFTR